jgi:GntR family transcriptional regulator, arabinose operon transcriptional repressor
MVIARDVTVYGQLVSDMKKKIENNILPCGSMLPSEKEMVKKYKISRSSVRKALDILENNSLISREPGRGTFVKWTASKADMQNQDVLDIYVDRLIRANMSYDWYLDSMFNGINEACVRTNFRVITPNLLHKSSAVRNDLVAGIFVAHSSADDAIRDILLKRHAPVAYVNKFVPGDNISCFYLDDQIETKKGIEHLISLGHRKIGIIYDLGSKACRRRKNAFDECLSEHDIELRDDAVLALKDTGKDMHRMIWDFFERKNITAVFLTFAALVPSVGSAVNLQNFKVPEDLSILVFDDIKNFDTFQLPPLTSIRVPLFKMGKAAAEHVCDQIRNNKPKCVKKCFTSELVIRESTTKIKNQENS